MAKKTPFSPITGLFSRITAKILSRPEKVGKGAKGGDAKKPPKSPPTLRLLFFIIDWTKTKAISRIFEEEKVRFHFITKGRGTAGSDILDLLGIGASDKAVVICLEQVVMAPVLIKEVRKRIGSTTPGAGIAFTVPLSGINTPLLQVFKDSVHTNENLAAQIGAAIETIENIAAAGTGGRTGGDMPEIKNDLIVSIINQGYSDEFMTAAREAGARGGTVINARGLAHEGPVKFFGVSVQAEKEIILILTNREKKSAIMHTVSETYGIASKAEGIIFSLPADVVMGLNFEE